VEQQYWIRGSCSLSEIFFSDVELAGWVLAGRLGDFLHLILVSPLIRPVNDTTCLEHNKTLTMMSLTQEKRIHYLKKFCLLFTVSVPSILKSFIKEGLQLSNLQIA
jgi:hypothetical protein